MSSLDAFNEMYSDFIKDLGLAFPDDPNVLQFKSEFDELKAADPKGPMTTFMKLAGAKAQALTTRDPSFIQQFSFGPVWASASPRTKEAIWQHLNGLYMIAMTLTMFPPETLEAIEGAAKRCAESGAFDPSIMSSLLAGMMGPGAMGAPGPARGRGRPPSGARPKKTTK
jgi:hypothetical protein